MLFALTSRSFIPQRISHTHNLPVHLQHWVWIDSVWSPSPNLFKSIWSHSTTCYYCSGFVCFFFNSNINCWWITTLLKVQLPLGYLFTYFTLINSYALHTSWYLSDFGRTQTWNKNENCSIPAIFFNIAFIFKQFQKHLASFLSYLFWVTSVDTSYEPCLEAAV